MFSLRFGDSVVVDMSLVGLALLVWACSSEPSSREAEGEIPAVTDSPADAGSKKDSAPEEPDDAATDAGPDGKVADPSSQDDAGVTDDAGGDTDAADGGDAVEDASIPDDSADAGETSDGGDKPKPPAKDERVWGVTIDDIDNVAAITTSLKNLAKKPTARVVFDEFMPATYYERAVKSFHEVSFVMGELLDSWYVSQYSVADYDKRTVEYLDRLFEHVDIWEIGNEINGEWLCDQKASRCTSQQAQDVVKKMTGAYDRVKARGGKTALTLYYNKGCYSQSSHEMFTWTRANVPERMKSGLDYVFVSYYEDDCNGLQPNWENVFTELGQVFPNSKLGFGECGTDMAARKAEYIDRYYRMKLDAPRYVGGYFWWYFRRDMVPYTNPLWGVLNQAIADG